MSIREHFCDELSACEFVEHQVWPDGPECPHCHNMTRLGRLHGHSTIIGTLKCYCCRKLFTVRVHTIFRRSHVPIHVWLQAAYLLVGCPQRLGAQRLAHILGVSVRTAWHLKHTIQEAVREHGESLIQASSAALKAQASRDLADKIAPGPLDDIMSLSISGPDTAMSAAPGSGVAAGRFRRFLTATEPFAAPATDRMFMQIMPALVSLASADPAAAQFPSIAIPDQSSRMQSPC